ncbi:MAG: hypothetical protein R3C40_11440 [Parvularculaceae bacterium]
MILRRIAEHVKAQNWTAVALDFVIVVAGVFMGIQLGNWNEARNENNQLDQQLTSLRVELEENQQHFSDYRAELVQQMDDVNALRAAFKKHPPAISAEEVNARLLNVGRIKVFAPDLTALNELAETGGLRRIPEKKTRQAISDWQRALDSVTRNYDDGLRERDGVFNPFLLTHIVYGPLLEQSYIVGEGIEKSKFRTDVSALAESRDVDNQLAYRYGITGSTVYVLDALVTQTTQLIDMLSRQEAKR